MIKVNGETEAIYIYTYIYYIYIVLYIHFIYSYIYEQLLRALNTFTFVPSYLKSQFLVNIALIPDKIFHRGDRGQ